MSMDVETASQPKRYLTLACDGCRRRKIKCTGTPGPCSGCLQGKITCHFSGYVKPRRTPVRSNRRVKGLEQRLEHIEKLLEKKIGSTDSTAAAHLNEIRNAIGPDIAWTAPSIPLVRDHLPLLEEVIELATEYFAVSNKLVPIFDETHTLPIIRTEKENLAPDDSAIWAAINVILALAHQQRSAALISDGVNHQAEAMKFLDNAVRAIGDFSLPRQPCVLSAQVLLGIAEAFRASSTPQKSSMYVAMAVRQIYHLGLHRPNSPIWSDTAQSITCLRLFWAVYAIDRDVSLRLDQPPMLAEKDFNLTKPCPPPTDDIGTLWTKDGRSEIPYFQKQVELALIQDETFRTFNTARNELQTSEELKCAGCEIATTLERWLERIDVEFTMPSLTQDFSQSAALALVVLFARYFNTLTTAHRLSYWTVEELDSYKSSFEGIATTECPSQALCVRRARQLLGLFPILPQGDVSPQWLLVDCFVSAAVILLAGMVYGAPYSAGIDDLRLVQPVVSGIATLARYGDTERLQYLWKNCSDLLSMSKNMLQASGLEV